MNVIPAIDIRDGRCVRLLKGDFDRETAYSDDPAGVAQRFAQSGCTDLHVVDLDGARSGTQKNRHKIAQIAEATSFAVQLGGGIRDLQTVRSWLADGVRRCVLGSVAVTAPHDVRQWLDEVGAERLVLALDVRIVKDQPYLATHGWTRTTESDLWSCIDTYAEAGLRHVLCTDIDRDGAMAGPNIDLYRDFVVRYPDIELQASGGVRDLHDLSALRDAGVPAAITGRALLDGRIGTEDLAAWLRDA